MTGVAFDIYTKVPAVGVLRHDVIRFSQPEHGVLAYDKRGKNLDSISSGL
jgi:hypothetical protein